MWLGILITHGYTDEKVPANPEFETYIIEKHFKAYKPFLYQRS
jgi:hypothetical protein